MDSGARKPMQPAGLTTSEGIAGASSLVLVPDHELLRPIGKGSYGAVWLARNMMGTYRAVKIIYRRSFEDERPFERELSGIRRFEPVSRCHDGLVDVLQIGSNEQSGYFYYVMEVGDDEVSGQSIDPEHYSPKTLAKTIAAQGRLTVRDSLKLGLALSLALAELHKNNLVHRDIKPSNIIFVNGVPKLADIGLVAGLDEARSYVGTEGFIPPEGPGTPQADVYGLGKVLYEAATGKDRQEFPQLPTELDNTAEDHGLFLELNEILLQACEINVSRRYPCAWDMHADLLVLANGRSVKRLKVLERRWTSVKRTAGFLALALVVLAGYGYGAYRQHRSAVELHQRQVSSNYGFGNRALESGDLLGSLPYFAAALQLERGNADHQRENRLRFGATHAQCAKIVQMWFAPGEVGSVGFSPDGSRVLAIERHGKAQVFEIETGKPISPRFGQSGTLWRGSFSPDGKLVATASEDKTACIWNVSDGSKRLCLNHPNKVLSANFSPDGSRLVTSCIDNLLRVWAVPTGKLQLELPGHTGHIRYAAFSPDGRQIVSTSEDGTARLWDATDGHALLKPLVHPKWVLYAAFSPDGQTLVTAGSDHTARIWEAATGRRIWPDLNHQDLISSVEFSPDGRLILTAGLDKMVRLWRVENHQPVRLSPVLRHSDRVMHAVFSSDGHRLVTGCADGTVRVWDLAGCTVTPRPRQEIFSDDGSRFISITNRCIEVWETLSGAKISPLIPANAIDARLSQQGRYVLALSPAQSGMAASQHVLRVWETGTGKPIGQPIRTTSDLASVALTSDGKRLLVVGNNVVRTWDVATGAPLVRGLVHYAKVQSAVWSPSGEIVASWAGQMVKVWDGATGQELFAPIKHPFPIQHVEFNPDGSRLVTCGADEGFSRCFAQIWNVKTGQPVGSPMVHDDGVLCAHFSSDGKRVVTASEDFTAIVWDAATGARLTPAIMHSEKVFAASFSPDGQWFVTASGDKTARVWSAETGDPLTPWLVHPAMLADARFSTDASRIVTSDRHGNCWLCELPVDRRPANDLMMLARLLSGDTVTPWGQVNAHKQGSLQAIWRRLRSQYPADFSTSTAEIAAWHEFQATESELEGQWSAATFHLDRCRSLRPGDPNLAERLARARQHLPAGKR